MKTRHYLFGLLLAGLAMTLSCSKDDSTTSQKSYLDTLVVTSSMKGWELYSWKEGQNWHFSILRGTDRIKTYEEVTSRNPSTTLLIQVVGTDSVKLVLNKFPEHETITWIGAGWLATCWQSNYGNLQLPPGLILDEIGEYCISKNIILQVTN
jgi:hypothetical protein